MQNIYIIEHLEPKLYKWCIIEYKHISKIVGKDNLWFTNIKEKDKNKLENYGQVHTHSVKIMQLENACVLDPEAPKELLPKDKERFQFLIFGGILGDHPPRKRTQVELTRFIKNKEIRNIGKDQFSTDNAVYVTKTILSGTPLEKIPFQNSVEIQINDIESTILPFKYPLVNGKPNISKELIEYLKKEESQ